MRFPPIPEQTKASLVPGNAIQRLAAFVTKAATRVTDNHRLPRGSLAQKTEQEEQEPEEPHRPKPRLKPRPSQVQDMLTGNTSTRIKPVDLSNPDEVRAVLARGWTRL